MTAAKPKGRPKSAAGPLPIIISLRGTTERQAWANGLAKQTTGKDGQLSALIWRLLKIHAEASGFEPPPPR